MPKLPHGVQNLLETQNLSAVLFWNWWQLCTKGKKAETWESGVCPNWTKQLPNLPSSDKFKRWQVFCFQGWQVKFVPPWNLQENKSCHSPQCRRFCVKFPCKHIEFLKKQYTSAIVNGWKLDEEKIKGYRSDSSTKELLEKEVISIIGEMPAVVRVATNVSLGHHLLQHHWGMFILFENPRTNSHVALRSAEPSHHLLVGKKGRSLSFVLLCALNGSPEISTSAPSLP